MRKARTRRTDREKVQVGSFNDGVRRYYDHNMELTVVKLYTGDCYVSADPGEMLVTILGSCISVCMRDPVAGVGGMNHFLLPGNTRKKASKSDPGYSTRFGIFAIEELINQIMHLGGQKERLEVKLFGGGNVIKNSAMIGEKNIEFAESFLRDEGFKVDASDVGGQYPRRLHYYLDSGKIMVRKLKRKEDMEIVEEEKAYKASLGKKPKKEDLELF